MIFLTGGTGMLGSYILKELLANGISVIALKRPSSKTEITRTVFNHYGVENLFSNIKWIDGDLNDIEELQEHIEQCRLVIHSAAMVSYNPDERKQMTETNMGGTSNLVNLLLRIKNVSLIHISSIAALGNNHKNEAIDETCYYTTKKNSSFYSFTKFNSEMEVWRGIAEGLNAMILNPSVILGIGNWKKGSSSLFKLVDAGLKYFPPGTTGFVHASDVAKITTHFCSNFFSGQSFIINSENLSWKIVFSLIAKSLNKKPPKYVAGKLLTGIAWRYIWFRNKLSGRKDGLSRETARTSQKTLIYSNQKISNQMQYKFDTIEQTISEIAKAYRKSQ
jgi:dihydroflavonol-4-reductase